MALVKFNGEVETITKDAKNPHFKNKYASLDNIIEEIRPVLSKHGITVMQIPSGDGETVSMKTMLLHESGEWMESEPLVMRPVKNDPQGVGSCITYARRYSLCSMLSLSTGEDDDGNHASQPQRAAQSAPQGTAHQPSGQRSQASTGQSRDMQSYKKKALDMMQPLGMDWNNLASFASDLFGRSINKIVSDIKTDGEWHKLYEGLLFYQQEGRLPDPARM